MDVLTLCGTEAEVSHHIEKKTEMATTKQSIDRLIAALGGADAVKAATIERISATGWRRHPGWGHIPETPEHVADFDYTLDLHTSAQRYRMNLSGHTFLVPSELDYLEIGSGDRGHVTGVDFMFDPRPVDIDVPFWRVAARLRHFDLTSILRVAHKLLASSVVTDLDADGRIVLREFGRPDLRIRQDAEGNLIALDLIEEHAPRGDAAVRITFHDYRPTGRLRLPHEVDIAIDGVCVHHEARGEITVLEEDDENLFELAAATGHAPIVTTEQAAYALSSTEWIMNYVYSGVRFYFDVQNAPVTAEPIVLAEGVKLVVGPSHNTLVVELVDSTLAVEAPMYDNYSRAALAQVKACFPDKPLRDLVGTHFHYDHIGGIREFAADGDLTVHVGTPTVPFFEEVLMDPHTVDPDRLASAPTATKVVGIDDLLTFPMANGCSVQVFRMISDHAADMVFVYVSSGKIVFNSDLWNPTPVVPPLGAQRGRLATQLYDAIIERGLDVETILGGHGTVGTHTAPLAFLKQAAGYDK